MKLSNAPQELGSPQGVGRLHINNGYLWFSLDFLFIEKSCLGSPGIAFWSDFGGSLVPLGSLVVVIEGSEMPSKNEI